MPSTVEPVIVPSQQSAAAAFADPTPRHVATVHTESVLSDVEIVSRVHMLLGAARDHRKPLIARWKSDYRMLFNKFWKPSRLGSWQPSPQVPEIFPILRALAGFMVDRRITNTVSPYSLPMTPWNDFLSELADDLETTLDAGFQANREEREWIISIVFGFLYGTGIQKTCWETKLAGGLGDAMTRYVHPFTFYPDPSATCTEDGDFFIEVKRLSVQELDRRFPGAYEKVSSNAGFLADDEQPPTIHDFGQGSRTTPYVNPGTLTGGNQPANYFQAGSGRIKPDILPAVDVIECWVREHTFASVTDDRTGDKTQFPRESWRVIVVAANKILMDEPAKNLWEHGGHPYSRFTPFDMGEFWGPSLVELLSSSQHAINRVLSALQQNVELTGNPIWKEGARAGTNRQPISNRPGTRVTVNDPSVPAGWESPPQLQAASMELLRYHLARMEAISGITAINKGGMPGGRNAQGTIEAVQESAFVVIRLAQKFLEYAMRDAGERRASLIIENYTNPRLISIAGRDAEKSFRVLKARHFMIPTSKGAIPMKFQLNVDAGSRQNTARQMVEDRAMQAFTVGLVDDEAALKAMDWPDAAAVSKRNAEKKQAAMEAEASMKQKTRA